MQTAIAALARWVLEYLKLAFFVAWFGSMAYSLWTFGVLFWKGNTENFADAPHQYILRIGFWTIPITWVVWFFWSDIESQKPTACAKCGDTRPDRFHTKVIDRWVGSEDVLRRDSIHGPSGWHEVQRWESQTVTKELLKHVCECRGCGKSHSWTEEVILD